MRHRTAPLALLAGACLLSPAAMAANPLHLAGEISATDPISFEEAGGGWSFHYDLVRIAVDTDGVYNFSMTGSDSFAPWFGVFENGVYDPTDFNNSPWIGGMGTVAAGATIATDLDLVAGVYELVLASTYWIDQNSGLDLGPYTATVTGPTGADITIVPAPAAGVALLGVLAARRRR